MGLKSFFSYFGAKTSHAARYPEPLHDTIIEPFAGSGGYSLRYFEKDVRLNDKDPTIVGVWRYLIAATKSDILSLPLAVEDVRKLSQSEQDFIGFWWVRCGASPCKHPVPWMKTGLYPYSFWGEKTRSRIADQVGKIKHWKCQEASFEQIRNKSATWFIDPPYQKEGGRYKCGSKEIDYSTLAKWVRERRGQVIACESGGATYLPFSPLFENSTIKYRKVRRTVQEIVYVR